MKQRRHLGRQEIDGAEMDVGPAPSNKDRTMLEGFQILARGGLLRRSGSSQFEVRDLRERIWYKVEWKGKTWRCECRNGRRYVSICSHAVAVMLLLRLPTIMTMNLNPEQFSCPRCGAELEDAELSGVLRLKSGLVQRYACQKCGYRFNDRLNFEKLKANPSLVVISVDLYLRGLSAKEVASHLKMIFGCEVNQSTVYRWVIKYCRILQLVEKEILPSLRISRKWHGDEVVTKVNGSLLYLWDILDAKSRYLLATSLRAGRDTATFKKVIEEVIARVGKPDVFITDGLASYKQGLREIDPRIRHVAGKRLRDKGGNNKLERMNKSIRRRTKVSESFMSPEKADILLNGYRVHYNLVRPHSSLKDRTPGERAGFRFKSRNKLLELINTGRGKMKPRTSERPVGGRQRTRPSRSAAP